jgi:molybdopterin-guanine dinucleotide biosynthesis protein A
VWPGTPVIRLTADAVPGPAVQSLAALADLGARQAAVLAADAPDLPPLLIGKLLRALGSERRADVAICPAEGGGLVALAAWLPPPAWLAGVHTVRDGAELDVADIAERLRGAAPSRGAVRNGPGWHRMRSPADLARLDPGLEGWAATRELLTARGPRP